MAKSYEELKQQAAVVKNETSDGANTAKRIGTMFEDAIDFTDANIGQSVGLIVTDYKGTPKDTRMSVDARFRKKGSVMTYNPGTGYIMEQYIGTTLLDSEWQKGTNWRPYYADENIQNIAEYARSAGEEAQAKGAEAVQIAQTSGEEAKQIAQAAANEASTQAAYAKEQGDRLSSIDLSLYRVVIELPSIPEMSDDDMNKIYLKVSAKQGENNKYDEFVVVDGIWELLGQYEAAIDLTDYVGKDELSSEIAVLPALENISKFVCIDENGEAAGVMTKEQVAQVVGGLNGIFKYEGEVGTYGIKDFNEAYKTGFYKIAISGGTISHRPFNVGYAVMFVLNTGTYILQVVFDLFNSTACFRGGDGSFNDTWHKFNQ